MEKDSHQTKEAGSSRPPGAPLPKNSLDPLLGPNPKEIVGRFPSSFSGLPPVTLPSSDQKAKRPPLDKFQHLKQTVTKRLSSLDPGWLDRCQGTKLQLGNGLVEGNCFAPAGGVQTGARSLASNPLGNDGEVLPHLERKQETGCDSPKGSCQGDIAERTLPTPNATDKCRTSVQEKQAARKSPSKEEANLAPVEKNVTSVTKHIHKLQTCLKDATWTKEMALAEVTFSKAESTFCKTDNGPRPAKTGELSFRMEQQDSVVCEGNAPCCSRGGTASSKRKRTKEPGRGSRVKKRRAASPPKPGLDEYVFDGQGAAEVQEGKERVAAIPGENLLGEVEGDEQPKWSGRSRGPACRCVQGGKQGRFVLLKLGTVLLLKRSFPGFQPVHETIKIITIKNPSFPRSVQPPFSRLCF